MNQRAKRTPLSRHPPPTSHPQKKKINDGEWIARSIDLLDNFGRILDVGIKYFVTAKSNLITTIIQNFKISKKVIDCYLSIKAQYFMTSMYDIDAVNLAKLYVNFHKKKIQWDTMGVSKIFVWLHKP